MADACGHTNPSGAKFCLECGASLGSRCPQCRAELAPTMKFCGECGARVGTAESRADPEGGERRQLTVLFCDLVRSTELSGRLDPEEWEEVVRAYQEATAAVVEKHGGHLAQYLGDGVLVYFGYPQAHEDDAERALRAGLAIVNALPELNAGLAADRQLAVRVGIHTGPVVVSRLGGGSRRETLALGETTNVAARLQGLAVPDTVVASAATQALVPGIFVLEELGAQALKGVAEPMVCYRVLRPSGVRSRLDVAAGRLTRFVGRDLELATLVDRWERAAEGEGQNVLVVGEAGVGKSRLVYQLHERLAAVPHTWLECRATPYTEGTPFHPVIDLVQQGLAFAPEDTAADKVEKLQRAVTLARFDRAEAVPLVADFLELAPPEGYPRLALNPDVQRRKTMELLAAWNLALAEVQPLVLLIEDLHWVDPSSLELLGRLMAQTATARVLLIGTARPDFTPPWPARSNLMTLQLARLTKRQAREMIEALAGGSLSAELVDTLVARADGVPLYVEELTKGVAEPNVARGVDAIPATLADSLMARLDRLSAAKGVAQRASVIGREFPYALLAAMAEMDEAALQHGLARLVEAEILFVRGEPPAAAYTFKHALVQEAAYESLLKRTRQRLHGRVVDVLIERFPERVAAEPEVVARHAEAAGRPDDAITYYDRAGEQAQAGSAHEEAIGQFRNAIVLLEARPAGAERDARELRVQLALGASLNAVRGFSHAETGVAYERALVLAAATADGPRLGLARGGLGHVYYNRGEVERGRALGAELLADAEARGDREQVQMGHNAVAIPEFYQGKFASSLAHCKRALRLYEPVQHHAIVSVLGTDTGVNIFTVTAWNLWCLGQPDAALVRAREAVALARRLDHPFNLAHTLVFETAVHWFRRDVAAQRERASEVVALSQTQGFPLWLGVGRALHAAARVTQGDPSALAEILDGMALAAATGSQAAAPALFSVLAEAQQAAGQLADAQGTVATGLAIAAQTGQLFFDADLHRLDGDLLLATGGADDEAAARYHRALAIAREQGARSFELRAATSLARLLRDKGRPAEARALLAPIYATFTEGFGTPLLTEAKALLEELSA